MNLDRVCNDVLEYWSGAGFEVVSNDGNCARLMASVNYRKFYGERSIELDVYAYQSGACHVFADFGKVNYRRKQRTLELVNEFNRRSAWFRAYLSPEDDNYLSGVNLHFSVFEDLVVESSEKRTVDYINFAIGQILDDDFYDMFKGILEVLE